MSRDIDTRTASPEQAPADSEAPRTAPDDVSNDATVSTSRPRWTPILSYAVLPAAALLLAVASGWLKWAATIDDNQRAAAQSTQAASDATVALLSYRPDTVEAVLGAARERTTGSFRDAYNSLTHDVVIPGAQQKKIAATATVPAAGSISATPTHAVVLVFVNQTVTVAGGPPSSTASTVRVTLDKPGAQWLVSGFDPI